jgi:anaerobic selenocysteine-containing dehydrogenase
VHPEDLESLGLKSGAKVKLGSARGVVTLHAQAFEGVRKGVLISESIWPNEAFEDGKGINTLTGSDQPAPAAGGAFHDNRVWLRPA